MNLRIRGIYATALSALLPAHGFALVDSSPIVAERLGNSSDGEADVKLYDRPDHQGVRLAGTRAAAGEAARTLAALLPDAAVRAPRGESPWEVEFPGGSKRRLDEVRAEVWPTVPGHHQFKIVDSGAVDRAEEILASQRATAQALASFLRRRFILSALQPGREVVAEHVKPDGRELRMPGRVAGLEGRRLRLTRLFRSGGVYDSLNARKLAGDHGEVEQVEGSWVSRRRYLRADGTLIGELYNVQTPTEFYPSGVRYLDLEVDVAAWPNGRVEIVDLPELRAASRSGWISRSLAERALEVAEGVRATLAGGEPVRLEDWL